jgi:hypothetical protein
MIRKTCSLLFLVSVSIRSICQSADTNLPLWQEGYLDIHHINTGRGNSTFCVFPDGTTLLIDAGDLSETHPRTASPRNCPIMPDNSKSPPEWIVYYIRQVYPGAIKKGLDFALITHYHDDHFGEDDGFRKNSGNGYVLTGITEVGTLVNIGTLIDRGFDEPVDIFSNQFREKMMDDEYHLIQTLDNYKKYLDYAEKAKGLKHEKIIPGKTNQISLKHKPGNYSEFKVQNVFGNGKIWYGQGDSCFFALQPEIYPGENSLSIGLKISYSGFDYYTGGDIPGVNRLGQTDYMSMEAQTAPIVGIVDIATLNHHGNRDSQSDVWVRTLRPSIWIQQNWSSDHPGEEVLNRIVSEKLYPGARDIYSTCMTETTKNYIGEAVSKNYKSTAGHVLIRVYNNKKYYEVFVLDDSSPILSVKSVNRYNIKE